MSHHSTLIASLLDLKSASLEDWSKCIIRTATKSSWLGRKMCHSVEVMISLKNESTVFASDMIEF